MDTVPTNLTTYHALLTGLPFLIRKRPIPHIIAMAILDCMVKYIKTLDPPMKECLPAYALRKVPTTADITTTSLSIELTFFCLSDNLFIVIPQKIILHCAQYDCIAYLIVCKIFFSANESSCSISQFNIIF